MNKNIEASSKKQIIKSTGIIGSSQIITIVLQVVRTKIIALLLGPAGVGLLGIYNTIIDMIRNTTGLGINFSGVRELAQVLPSNDGRMIAQKALLLKRWAIITGIIGGGLLILFCYPISLVSFNNGDYAWGIALLAVAVFFSSISQSQIAVLQGMRKLAYMAKASVFGIILSILVVTPIYYFWGTDGMLGAIILMSIASYLLSQYYVSKLRIGKATMSLSETWSSGKEMIKIGFATSISAIVTSATMYLVRSYISSNGCIEDAGYFQASWSISNVYLLSVLNAMAADFFPRLSAVNKDNTKVNQLVNEQTEIALLIGGVLVVFMLCFSKLIISILYTSSFTESITLLNYFAIGSFFKLLAWPICYISAAKGAIKQILISEISWNVFFYLFTIILWDEYKLDAIGISYFISYLLYLIILLFLSHGLSKFRWVNSNIYHILFYGFITAIIFFMVQIYEIEYYLVSIASIPCILYSLYFLNKIISINEIFAKFIKKN